MAGDLSAKYIDARYIVTGLDGLLFESQIKWISTTMNKFGINEKLLIRFQIL